MKSLISGVLLMLLSGVTAAEQMKDFGDYEVHYIAFASTFLQPDIAARYDINRSRSIGVVNISVLRKTPEGTQPVSALVDGHIINDVRQELPMSFQRINEAPAYYALSSFPFSEGELLTFQLEILPEGSTQTLYLRFSQQLFGKSP